MESYWKSDAIEVGCDEAGRGCLAGPVVAAAVIWPKDQTLKGINDSKKLTAHQREQLRPLIMKQATAFAIAWASPKEIDDINILNASFLAMHRALEKLKSPFERILVDGNRFNPYHEVAHECMIKGDGRFMSIAAASILAKTTRDAIMARYAIKYPAYHWTSNAGYPTKAHRQAIMQHGPTSLHRMSFRLIPENTTIVNG